MLKIKQFAFNPFGVSTFVVYDPDTLDAIIVDPGMVTDRERKLFDDYIIEHHLNVHQVVNTHLHLDHCFGDNYVRDKYGVKQRNSAWYSISTTASKSMFRSMKATP